MHVGTARSATEPSWRMYDVRGVRVAHLDYTYGLNGIPVPKDKPWIVNLIDPNRILADAHMARLAGAQFVMVAMHWGTFDLTDEPIDLPPHLAGVGAGA